MVTRRGHPEAARLPTGWAGRRQTKGEGARMTLADVVGELVGEAERGREPGEPGEVAAWRSALLEVGSEIAQAEGDGEAGLRILARWEVQVAGDPLRERAARRVRDLLTGMTNA